MAKRPVFMVMDRKPYVKVCEVEFEWSGGFAVSQKQKNIAALHAAFAKEHPYTRVLEISSKSMQEGGMELSAFSLPKFVPSLGRSIPLENVFQGGKVFEKGGPYTDLYEVAPKEAKRDERLKSSGKLKKFTFEGQDFPLEPETAFYDFLYVNALLENPELAKTVLAYDAFTDVEFNPEKSRNCQARAAALFVALCRKGHTAQMGDFCKFCALLQKKPEQQKKSLSMNILDILRRYTDADHRLSQKDIADILKTEYNMTIERKAIRRNLLELMDCGYNIEYSESTRMTPVKDKATGEEVMKESHTWSDFYLERDFTDGELRLLIDSLLFSKHVPYSQCKELVEKLEGLSNIYFKSRIGHITRMPDDQENNHQLFLNIELLDEAISKKRKVSFKYIEYGTDKKAHVRKRPDGSVREYTINPYQMAAKEGKYYLICNYDKYDDISNYRLDRIRDIKILDERVKPFEKLNGANGRSLDLAEYMREHVYMFSSENARVSFRVPHAMISDVLDMFGGDVRFYDETDTHVSVSARVNEMAMHQFAKSFAPDVVVLSPKSLADKVKEDLEKAVAFYG